MNVAGSTGFTSPSSSSMPEGALQVVSQAARIAFRHTASNRRVSSAVGPVECSRSQTKAIDAIEIGDLVWAWDDATSELVKRPVRRLFRHTNKSILQITIADASGQSLVIEATTEHPFWIDGQGWVSASKLRQGDAVKLINAGREMRVASVKRAASTANVFNFEVDAVHNYFVGAAGVLVHNESRTSSDRHSGSEGGGQPGKRYVLGFDSEWLNQLNRSKVVKIASIVALGATVYTWFGNAHRKYSDENARAIENQKARELDAPVDPMVARYALPVPQLSLAPEFAAIPKPVPSMRLTKPDFLVRYEQFRVARDAQLASEPLTLRHRIESAELATKEVGRGFLGIVPKYETLSPHDIEVAESKIRQSLRRGKWRDAKALSHDADLTLDRHNELVDEVGAPEAEAPHIIALRAVWTDWQFQADLADVGGRWITATPYGAGYGVNGVMERGRQGVTTAVWFARGLSETIDIFRDGVGGWGSTSYKEAWQKPVEESIKRGVYNFASELGGHATGKPGMREVQSLGRWSMQPNIWSSPAAQFAAMGAADTVYGIAAGQAIRWWQHDVDPSVPAPFAEGIDGVVLPDAAANGFVYTALSPGATTWIGGPVPWQFKALAATGARFIADEVYKKTTTP